MLRGMLWRLLLMAWNASVCLACMHCTPGVCCIKMAAFGQGVPSCLPCWLSYPLSRLTCRHWKEYGG